MCKSQFFLQRKVLKVKNSKYESRKTREIKKGKSWEINFASTFLKQKLFRIRRYVKTDVISKQSQLELSQSGIGFVMGWNLAKS